MYCVITYEEGFCKRDENKYGDLLDIWQQDEWSFRILGMREGWRKTWRSFRDMAARWMEFEKMEDERGLDQTEG